MAQRASRRAAGWQPLGLALVVSLGTWLQTGTPAEGQSRSSRRPARGAEETSEKVDTAKLEAKLDQILENQDQILKRFDDVMEELRIVKVRATLK